MILGSAVACLLDFFVVVCCTACTSVQCLHLVPHLCVRSISQFLSLCSKSLHVLYSSLPLVFDDLVSLTMLTHLSPWSALLFLLQLMKNHSNDLLVMKLVSHITHGCGISNNQHLAVPFPLPQQHP